MSTTALTPSRNGQGEISTEVTRPTGIGHAAEQARVMAEIQSALTVAQRCPRDEVRAIGRIETACQRVGLAERSEYSYSRGGSEITGPTIDLMTVVANYWGNISYGFRELSQQNGESTVEAYAWDLESNSRRNVVFQVPHKITARGSVKHLTDPRDIYELVANQAQRRVRSCLEAVIPADVVDEAVNQCRATLADSNPVTPESLKKMARAFQGEFGVSIEQIEKRIGRRVDTMTPQQALTMQRIYRSLKDGMSTVESWFPPIEKPTGDEPVAGSSLKDRMKAKAAPKTKQVAPPSDEMFPGEGDSDTIQSFADDDEAALAEQARRHELGD